MRSPLLLLLLLCFLRLPARADANPHWLEVKTQHFTVVTDSGDKQARQIAAQFERMQALFAKLLPHAVEDTGSRIVVLALKDRKGFQAVEPPAYLAKNALDLAGLFMQRQDRSYILLRLDTSGEHPYSTIYHEYTHYMLRHAEYLPVWLNEGMAEFYQNTDLDEKTARLGQPSVDDIRFLREQHLLPLPALFAVDHNSPYYHEEDKGNIFYAESWALTHMLLIRDFQNHRETVQDYVVHLSRGENAVAAAQEAFGDLNQLQKDLDAYVNGGRFSLLRMPLQNTVSEAAFDVEPLDTPDADALRADVMMENSRHAEAQALIQTVLQQAPNNAQVHESLGLSALRQGNLPDARKWYGEAVALHSGSYLAYYYFGVLSMQMGRSATPETTDDAIGDSLHQALKLNPGFAPAADAMAQFDARHDHLDEAVQMILRAVSADPSNVNYRLNAAQIRVQRKEFAAADSILASALAISHTPEERQRVELRQAALQRYQTQMAQMKEVRSSTGVTGPSVGTGALAAHAPGARIPAAEVRGADGRVLQTISAAQPVHDFPPGPPSGPRHSVHGVLHGVSCFYPKGLTLRVDGSGSQLSLYSNDMYGIQYTASNFTPSKDLNPCQEFEGMKASVVYSEVSDKTVAGQIVAIELSR